MPRARDPNRDKAFELWKIHEGNITNREIAIQLDIDEKKVAVWKQRDKWNVVQQTENNVVQQKKKVVKKVRGPSDKQKKRSGNPNPPNQFSHRNNPKLLHGLRSKFLHQEQVEIMEAMEGLDVADQLWFQIEVKFSSIVRMQKIMWVEDANDHLKEESGGGESFKVSFAYERYESYIKAQARAMAEYRNLTKQFLEIAHIEDERILRLEQMRLNIEKTKAEVKSLGNGENKETLRIEIDYGDDS